MFQEISVFFFFLILSFVCLCRVCEDGLAFVFLAHYYYAWDILPQFHVFYHIWHKADTTHATQRTFIRMSPTRHCLIRHTGTHTQYAILTIANICGVWVRARFSFPFRSVLYIFVFADAEGCLRITYEQIRSTEIHPWGLNTSRHNNRLYISHIHLKLWQR